jgi:hypothetical protein
MRHATLVTIMILVGCVDLPTSDDQPIGGTEESEGAEVIVGIKPTHAPDDCPGGDGGSGADPNPIPAPRDCTVETSHDDCYACCDWNVDKVWGERCRRIPKRNKDERRLCWEGAEKRRSDCYLTCPRESILTIEALP